MYVAPLLPALVSTLQLLPLQRPQLSYFAIIVVHDLRVRLTVPFDQVFEAVLSGERVHVHVVTVDDYGVVAWVDAAFC